MGRVGDRGGDRATFGLAYSFKTTMLPGTTTGVPAEIDITGKCTQALITTDIDSFFVIASNLTTAEAALDAKNSTKLRALAYLPVPTAGSSVNKLYVRAAQTGDTADGLSFSLVEEF